MKKGKFYVLKENSSLLKEENYVYALIDVDKIDDKHKLVKIGKVHAILIDRIIFSQTFEFITDNLNNIFSNFEEISLEEAKQKIDNTQALLSKQIFRR